ncbi:hypothetical protein [Okeania sp. SIO2B3]|uniref:hypothetical protein n=1 Tax=Okeania sp. SIO2B3 TaxID=2607784 RepID=UPI0013C0D043|nr:hypothetical protein [Okeania sp. SIO2B3]NET41531.1 hypothetical protein [Okeania sp. SIO2B3]
MVSTSFLGIDRAATFYTKSQKVCYVSLSWEDGEIERWGDGEIVIKHSITIQKWYNKHSTQI